jgi:hypothetical protein
MGKYCREHIGKTFNDGKLVVVDGGDKKNYVKVKCNICAEDSELFGDGMFETKFHGLTIGRIPCGCSKIPQWTLQQYEIRIKRKIIEENLDIKFIRFGKSNSKISLTPVKLFCNRNLKEFEVAAVCSFFQGVGNQGSTFPIREKIDQFNLDNPNHVVWDNGKKSHRKVLCGFYCKTCESNGFESLYEISSTHLFQGKLPCYCSEKKNISGDHVVEISKRKLYEQGLNGVEVLGACKKGSNWYSVFFCSIHGVYSRRGHQLDTTGCQCMKCNPPSTGYDKTKLGSLYLLEIQTDSSTILGYGITNKIEGRLTTHRKNLNNLGYKILSTRIFGGSGTKVLSVENAVKSLHKTGLIDCEGFRRESISIDRKEEVLKLCVGLKEIEIDTKISLDIPPNL